MAFTRLVITHNTTTQQQIDQMGLKNNAPRLLGQNLVNYFAGLVSGTRSAALLTFAVGATQATATVTFTGAPSNGETMSLGNNTITAVTSGATGLQFNIGANVTASATNLAALINANATLSAIFSATSAVGVVTITVIVPGAFGNAIQLSESLSNTTATAFAGGGAGTAYTADLT
jgi:phage tail sheath gpL-like